MHGDPMMAGCHAQRTGAVVVFFHPDSACVARVNRLSAIIHCVVIDNTPSPGSREELGLASEITYLPNGENLGIATAINLGIANLIDEGYRAAFLFDQDSEPPTQMLEALPDLLGKLNQDSVGVALVGPAYDDTRLGGVAPFIRFKPWMLERIVPAGQALIDVDFLITSGSCLDLRCWNSIGPMDETLFIDFVDVEWCLRAKRVGYRILGVPWIRMRHELGSEPVRVFGRPYPMHSPLRHYYLFRNAIALMRRPDLPFSWKSTELMKLPVRLLIYSLMPAQKMEHLTMALRGLYDGWSGRLGRFERRIK